RNDEYVAFCHCEIELTQTAGDERRDIVARANLRQAGQWNDLDRACGHPARLPQRCADKEARMDETVAIIGGTGDLGFALAQRWSKAAISVVIGSRDRNKAEEAASRIKQVVSGAKVVGAENAEAAVQATIVV